MVGDCPDRIEHRPLWGNAASVGAAGRFTAGRDQGLREGTTSGEGERLKALLERENRGPRLPFPAVTDLAATRRGSSSLSGRVR